MLEAAGFEVAPVFHDTGAHAAPDDAVLISDELTRTVGLRVVPDWGWRCGDYAAYALRGLRPGYDFYWLVESDVLFKGNVAEFFAACEKSDNDLLGLDPAQLSQPEHLFALRLPDIQHWKATFALTRFSARLLDELLFLRIADSQEEINPRHQVNDEIFVYTHAKADPRFEVGNLRDYAPEWFRNDLFVTDPDMLRDWIEADASMPIGVFHPVRSKPAFIKIVAERLVFRARTLRKMSQSIAFLSDADMEEAKNLAAANFHGALVDASRVGKRRFRQTQLNPNAEQ